MEERDLKCELFRCCGDEDLYPFGCPRCSRLMVFCYECDTLYDDLCNLASHSGQPFQSGGTPLRLPRLRLPF